MAAEEEDWRAVCETSLFRNHVERLEHICKTDFNNNDSDFLKHYLRPVVTLLDSIRSSLEEHYTQGESDTDPPWIDRFERVVTFALHPGPIDVQMHKGDFYIHVSPANPRKLQIKYYDSASIHSRTLSTGNCVQMCSQLWTDELRSEAKSRFVYSNCIVWTKRGFDRKTWKQILCASSLTPSESHILLERVDSTEMSSTEKEAILAELNEKPLHILDLDFELLHSQVAYLPGSRDDRGGAVIVVSANSAIWENSEINSTELARLFMYYFRIPRESVQNCGCSFIIDARKGNKIRDILVCIGEGIALFQEKFPNAVRMAYIVMKKDSLLLLMSASKIRDKLNFEFQLVSNMEKLYKVIPQQDLPVDLGGDLGYNHDQWIKFRIVSMIFANFVDDFSSSETYPDDMKSVIGE